MARLFVKEAITECRKRGATRLDVLAFEFEMVLPYKNPLTLAVDQLGTVNSN